MSETVTGLMHAAQRARREKRLRDAHRDLTEAVALCRKSGATPDLVRALKGLGQIERDLRRPDVARPLYEEAVAICRVKGDPLTLAHAARHLGDVHRDAGRIDMAEPCYHEALALYRNYERTDPGDLANAIRPLAILKTDEGAVEEARLLWNEARDLYASVNVQAGVAECAAQLEGLGRER